MSRKFLTHIDLQGNELQNALIHKLNSDPTGVNGKIYYNTQNNVFRVYQAGAWKDLATGGQAASTVTLTGDVTGTGNVVNGTITVDTTLASSFATDIEAQGYADAAESAANDYTDTAISGLSTVYQPLDQDLTDISAIVGNGFLTRDAGVWVMDTATYLTTAVESLANTDGNISVSTSTGAVNIDLANDIDIAGNLTVTGDLNVEGNLNAVNRTEVNIEDNTIVLNTTVTGTPVADAGIKVERGTSTDASLLWDESAGVWKAGLAGTETEISVVGHTHTASDVTDFNTAVDSEIDAYLTGSDSISISSGAIDTTLATTSYLTKTGGLAVDVSSLESKLVADSFTKKYAATIGDSSNTSFAITHALGTRDVTVQVFDTATYDTVEVDVVRTSTSVVTVTFNIAPGTDAYRVVIVG